MEDLLARRQALDEADDLQRRACELAAHIHAATAELARLLAAYDESGAWAELGVRSCAQWLSFAAGLGLRTGSELIRVGHALARLPQVGEAFGQGRLSFDKVSALTQVATPADEHVWLELALQATASQLIRICREYRQAMAARDPEQSERHLARRGVWTAGTEDGMVRLVALLAPEDGELVVKALDAVRTRPTPSDPERPDPVPDPAEDTVAASRADALVEICETALASAADAGSGASAPTRQVVVHADVGLLTGEQADGRCQLESGMPLSVATAHRLGCDGEALALIERDGAPIDVGRRRRLVTPRLERALRWRDRTCRFPGCHVDARRADTHHLQAWYLGGRTDLDNLAKLCRFHHARLHDGVYRILDRGGGELVFETADGHRIGVERLAVQPGGEGDGGLRERSHRRGLEIEALTARALDGSRCDHAYVVSVIADACEYVKARAGP